MKDLRNFFKNFLRWHIKAGRTLRQRLCGGLAKTLQKLLEMLHLSESGRVRGCAASDPLGDPSSIHIMTDYRPLAVPKRPHTDNITSKLELEG